MSYDTISLHRDEYPPLVVADEFDDDGDLEVTLNDPDAPLSTYLTRTQVCKLRDLFDRVLANA